jgi:hypothetical protein
VLESVVCFFEEKERPEKFRFSEDMTALYISVLRKGF